MPCLLYLQCYMISRGRLRTHTLIEKRRARSSRCCGLALSHGLVLHIGITSLHLSPLDRIVQEKLLYTKPSRGIRGDYRHHKNTLQSIPRDSNDKVQVAMLDNTSFGSQLEVL